MNVVIKRVTRRQNTRNGNPVKVLHTDQGSFLTAPDAMVSHSIGDGWENVRAVIVLDKHDRVIACQRTDLAAIDRIRNASKGT